MRKLPPGHTVIWQDGNFGLPHAYWEMPPARARARQARRRAGGRAVVRPRTAPSKAQLVSDVPVGIFLSGGIDSSLRRDGGRRRGRTHEGVLDRVRDATFDEIRYARMMAERLDVEWISETLHERNLLDVLDAALDHIDEPLADPSFLPTFLLSRLAARHVKVVVGGDGGDELWGGYPTYRAHRMATRLRPRSRLDPSATSSAASSAGCPSTIATRAWSGSCAGSRSAGTTTW